MNRLRAFQILVPLTFALAGGCAAYGDVDGIDDSAEGLIAAGSHEEYGMLRFLNGPDAIIDVLDAGMALDIRAARNIYDHVRGLDGRLGGGDDNLLDSIYELDAIPYVGPATMDHILAYVDALGLVPSMTLEGVMLTDSEAAALVACANGATLYELDVAAALDVRAANAIIAARPIADVNALATVSYVGPVALAKLRDYAPVWVNPPANPALFSIHLRNSMNGYYSVHGADIAAAGGNTLAAARAACVDGNVTTLTDVAEDPQAHDFNTVVVFSHPDPIFPGSGNVWLGAYDRASGNLLDLYEAN